MYRFKIKTSGPLTALALSAPTQTGTGSPVQTASGDVCTCPSLMEAQQLARMFQGYGLLS